MIFTFICDSPPWVRVNPYEEGDTMYVPYAHHMMLIGISEKNSQLWLPLCYDKMLQAIPDGLRTAIVDMNVAYIEENEKESKVLGAIGIDFRRWLSSAR